MHRHTRARLGSIAVGLGMGVVLSGAGFSDYAQIHAMFTFSDLQLLLTFASAVALSALAFRLFVPAENLPRRVLHPGTVPGGLLLGAGWALSGACPAIVWVQIGEGRLAGVLSLLGIGVGIAVYPRFHRRFFGWPIDGCGMRS